MAADITQLVLFEIEATDNATPVLNAVAASIDAIGQAATTTATVAVDAADATAAAILAEGIAFAKLAIMAETGLAALRGMATTMGLLRVSAGLTKDDITLLSQVIAGALANAQRLTQGIADGTFTLKQAQDQYQILRGYVNQLAEAYPELAAQLTSAMQQGQIAFNGLNTAQSSVAATAAGVVTPALMTAGQAVLSVSQSAQSLSSQIVAAGNAMNGFSSAATIVSSDLSSSLDPALQQLGDALLNGSNNVAAMMQREYDATKASLGLAESLLQVAVDGNSSASTIQYLDGVATALEVQLADLSNIMDALFLANKDVDQSFNDMLTGLQETERQINAAGQYTTEFTVSMQESAQSLYDMAKAGGASAPILNQIANYMAQLSASAAETIPPIGGVDDAILTLSDMLNKGSDGIVEYLQKQIDQTKAALTAADALMAQARAAGASADAIAALQQKIDGFTDSLVNETAALRMAQDAGMGAAEGLDATTEASAGAQAESEGESRGFGGEGFMLLMMAQMALQVVSSFLKMGTQTDATFQQMQGQFLMTTQQMQGVEQGASKVAQTYGQSLNDVASALITLKTNTFNGVEGIQVVTAASKLATIEGQSLATTATQVAATIRAWGQSSKQAANDAGVLVIAADRGHDTIANMETALANVAPAARSAGMSINVTAGYLAVLSSHLGSAQTAETQLSGIMTSLVFHMSSAEKTAHSMGLSFNENTFASDNLSQRLQLLWKMTKGNVAEFEQFIGGSQNIHGALTILGESMNQIPKDVSDATNATYALNTAYKDAANSITSATNQVNGSLSVLSYQFAQASKPVTILFYHMAALAIAFLGQHLTIVIPILTALAVVIIALVIPALVAVLVPMLATAAAAMAAAAPVALLIGAIVLVALLLVSNWKQVSTALAPALVVLRQIGQAIWEAIKPGVLQLWQQLQGVWTQLRAAGMQLWQAIQPLMPLFEGIAAVLGGMLAVQLGIIIGLFTGLTRALATFIGGIATMVGGVVQVITGIVQVFLGFVRLFMDLPQAIVSGNWSKVNADLATIWHGIENIVQGGLNLMKGMIEITFGVILSFVAGFATGFLGFFKGLFAGLASATTGGVSKIFSSIASGLQAVITWIGGFVASIINWFNTLFHELVGGSIIPDMVNSILTWFGSLVSRGVAAIINLRTQMLQHIQELATQGAVDFYNFVNKVISTLSTLIARLPAIMVSAMQGMLNAVLSWGANILSAVGNLASNIASKIAGFLHFSKPEVGPLADIDTWGIHMGEEMAAGMIKGIPPLQDAARRMAQAAGTGIMAQGSGSVTAGAASSPMLQALLQILQAVQRQGQTNRVGTSIQPLGMGAVQQSIGQVNFNGMSMNNVQQLYKQLNYLAGLAQRYGQRGAASGIGVSL